VVHRHGINCRHLGFVRYHILKNPKSERFKTEQSNPTSTAAADVLLIELVSRTLKNILREWMRDSLKNCQDHFREPSEFLIRGQVSCLLNLVSGYSPKSVSFWQECVLPSMDHRYGSLALRQNERAGLARACRPFLFRIIRYLLSMTGLQLSLKCEAEMRSVPVYKFNFTTSDFWDSDVRVKHLSILDYAVGKLLLNQANVSAGISPHPTMSLAKSSLEAAKSFNPTLMKTNSLFLEDIHSEGQTSSLASKRLRELAIRSFRAALRSDTFNLSALKDLCLARAQVAEEEQNYQLADWLFLSRIKKNLAINSSQSPRHFSFNIQVTYPLLLEQLKVWQLRLEANRFVALGGASSFFVLQEVGHCVAAFQHQQREQFHLQRRSSLSEHSSSVGSYQSFGASVASPLMKQFEEAKQPSVLPSKPTAVPTSSDAPTITNSLVSGACISAPTNHFHSNLPPLSSPKNENKQEEKEGTEEFSHFSAAPTGHTSGLIAPPDSLRSVWTHQHQVT